MHVSEVPPGLACLHRPQGEFRDHVGTFVCVCSCAQPAVHSAAVLVHVNITPCVGAEARDVDIERRRAASAQCHHPDHASCAGLPDADA